MIEINAPVIKDYPVDLRTCIREDYPERPGDLPIRGGWGYTMEDAIIIDRNDPSVNPELIFDGVGMEYVIVEKRIYYELIVMRAPGDQYAGIKWELIDQETVGEDGREFDHLRFKVTAHREEDWEELKFTYERGRMNADFDHAEHFAIHEEFMRTYTAEFWFDITSFYGK